MVSFSSQMLLLTPYICSQAGYKSGLLHNFFIISFVPLFVFFQCLCSLLRRLGRSGTKSSHDIACLYRSCHLMSGSWQSIILTILLLSLLVLRIPQNLYCSVWPGWKRAIPLRFAPKYLNELVLHISIWTECLNSLRDNRHSQAAQADPDWWALYEGAGGDPPVKPSFEI